jgi:hypothetical protein
MWPDVSMSHTGIVDSRACHNCGATLHGRFCAVCGQEDRPLDPTVTEVAREVAQELSAVDGRIARSLRRLFFSPGFLTKEHLAGRRVAWISPVRLYLFLSVAYFAASSLLPQIGGSTSSFAIDTNPETRVELRKLGFANAAAMERAVQEAQAVWMPRAMFGLVPLFGWFVFRLRRHSGRRYPHFLVFSLHVHAAWFGVQAIALGTGTLARHRAVWVVVAFVSVLYGVGYVALAFQAVYGGRWRRAIRDTLIVMALYWAAVATTGASIALWTAF